MFYSNQLDSCKITAYVQKSIIDHGMDLCQPKNLTVRTHPKHNTQKGVGITSNWQHGFFHAYSFHNWFPDMQMILLDGKKCNSSCRVKKIDESLMDEQGESKVENRLRIEGRGIEKKDEGFKEERNGTGKRKINYRL